VQGGEGFSGEKKKKKRKFAGIQASQDEDLGRSVTLQKRKSTLRVPNNLVLQLNPPKLKAVAYVTLRKSSWESST
jgi:hypothetical protein